MPFFQWERPSAQSYSNWVWGAEFPETGNVGSWISRDRKHLGCGSKLGYPWNLSLLSHKKKGKKIRAISPHFTPFLLPTTPWFPQPQLWRLSPLSQTSQPPPELMSGGSIARVGSGDHHSQAWDLGISLEKNMGISWEKGWDFMFGFQCQCPFEGHTTFFKKMKRSIR